MARQETILPAIAASLALPDGTTRIRDVKGKEQRTYEAVAHGQEFEIVNMPLVRWLSFVLCHASPFPNGLQQGPST